MVEQAEEHELKFDQKTSYSCGVFVEDRVVGQILDMVEDSDENSSHQWVLFPTEPELHSAPIPPNISDMNRALSWRKHAVELVEHGMASTSSSIGWSKRKSTFIKTICHLNMHSEF